MINFNSKTFIYFSLFVLFIFFLVSSFLYFLLFPDKYYIKKMGQSNIVNNKDFDGNNNSSVNVNTRGNKIMDLFVSRSSSLKDLVTSPILDGDDPVIGNKDGSVVIVEFFDYDCEFCRKQHRIVDKLINSKYKDKVKLIVKNFPMKNKDSFSWKSSVAARCAYIQDSFVLYHKNLLNTDEKFSDELFLKLAKESNLNMKTFESCYKNQDVNYLIEDNIIEANDLEIYGVPFYYIGKQEIMGNLDIETLDKIIKIELDK
jgi:protein-disulfide isomerase